MKVFYSNDFKGVWAGGASAIIVAPNEEEARKALDEELKSRKMKGAVQYNGEPCTLQELEVSKTAVVVLWDGDCC